MAAEGWSVLAKTTASAMQQKQKRNAWVHVYVCACVLVIVCHCYSKRRAEEAGRRKEAEEGHVRSLLRVRSTYSF